jgi:hypothetical protein
MFNVIIIAYYLGIYGLIAIFSLLSPFFRLAFLPHTRIPKLPPSGSTNIILLSLLSRYSRPLQVLSSYPGLGQHKAKTLYPYYIANDSENGEINIDT